MSCIFGEGRLKLRGKSCDVQGSSSDPWYEPMSSGSATFLPCGFVFNISYKHAATFLPPAQISRER
jgi:hypothetical protein